jgi:hypothetical protein
MSQVKEITQQDVVGKEESSGPIQSEQEFQPIFEEIQGMNPDGAMNVLIQAAQHAQNAGALSLRDSVVVAQAINILRPGSI